jgi:hypothetical protein
MIHQQQNQARIDATAFRLVLSRTAGAEHLRRVIVREDEIASPARENVRLS